MAKKIKDAEGNTYVQKKPFYKKWWFILLVVIVLIAVFSGGGDDDTTATNSNEASESSSTETSEATEEDKAFAVGDVVTVGDIDYTVNGVETTKSVGPSVYPTDAQDTFLVIDLTVKNNGNESIMVDTSNFKLIDGEKSFDADSSGSISANQDAEGNSLGFFLENINPDVEMQGKIVFDVTEAQANSETAQLGLTDSMFSSDYTLVNLR
ncbi:DUF4352 domain-containing protein [Desemzia sp. FAM 23991]|uniref:DUF4352 domain-containing protein n=1 Tax=unclassified Desemzia TaxID=2685243 RepID=UPI0038880FBE